MAGNSNVRNNSNFSMVGKIMIQLLISLLNIPLIILGYIGYKPPVVDTVLDLMGIA